MCVWVWGWSGHGCPAPLHQVRKPSCSRQSWQLTNPEGSAAWALFPQCLSSAKTGVGNCSKLLRRICSSILTICAHPHVSAVTLQWRKVFWRQRLDNLFFWLLNSILLFLINLRAKLPNKNNCICSFCYSCWKINNGWTEEEKAL